MKLHLLQLVKFFIGWPLSLFAIYYLLQSISFHTQNIFQYIAASNLFFLFLSMVCFVVFYTLRIFLWQQILAQKGYPLSFKTTAFLWEYAELKRFVPGNIWSFLSRHVLFSSEGVPKKVVSSAIALEITFFLLGCMLVSLLSLTFIVDIYASRFAFLEILLYIIPFLAFLFLVICIIGNRTIVFLPHFSPIVNLQLILITALSAFFFGLGTYLTITSFLPLPLDHILSLIGYFVFSLLAGYLSFITPMGLGVREGVMAFGLLSFIPFSLATIASLFARFTLIITEILLLIFTFAWNKTDKHVLIHIQQWIQKHIHVLILVFFIFLYITYFTNASFLRHDNFYTGRFDLGNMSQTVWNTAHGRIFQLTDPDGTQIISRLFFHADFILILLAPFHLIWPDPKMLLLVQSVILGMGAFFVYALGTTIIKNKTVSLVLAFVFLMNPSVEHANLFDFHAVSLATTFLLGSIYFLCKKNYKLLLVFLLLSAFTKENLWIICSLFGIYIAIFQKKKIFGGAVFFVSLGVFYYLIWHVIPAIRGSEHFALSYYSDFGSTPTHIITNILFSPIKTLTILTHKEQLVYLLQLFSPLGFLSLFAPFFLVFALPDLLINLLSNNSQLHQIYFQYSATIIPFLFISTLYGIRRIAHLFLKLPLFVIALYLLTTTLITSYLFGPLPGAKNPNTDMFTKPELNKTTINNVLSTIPQNASVAATNNLGSHLSYREKIFTIPVGLQEAEYVTFLLNDPFAQPSPAAQLKMIRNFKTSKQYTIIYEENNFIVFKKIL